MSANEIRVQARAALCPVGLLRLWVIPLGHGGPNGDARRNRDISFFGSSLQPAGREEEEVEEEEQAQHDGQGDMHLTPSPPPPFPSQEGQQVGIQVDGREGQDPDRASHVEGRPRHGEASDRLQYRPISQLPAQQSGARSRPQPPEALVQGLVQLKLDEPAPP